MPYEVSVPGGHVVSDDPARLDVALIHRYIAEESYWARGRPLGVVQRSIANSLCFGIYGPEGDQRGFARVVSDHVTMAHLNDVFVLSQHRGLGLGKALVGAVLAHPELRTVPRWTLHTRDAHGLYAAFGFEPMPPTASQMLRIVPQNQPPGP
jgi:GNAT superfamily N-acetyltransferase